MNEVRESPSLEQKQSLRKDMEKRQLNMSCVRLGYTAK